MATAITPEERATWLATAVAAGLSAEDDRDTLIAKAAALGVDAHWVTPRGTDIHGQEHERFLAYVVTGGVPGDNLQADTVEAALRLVVGEALTKRAEAEARRDWTSDA